MNTRITSFLFVILLMGFIIIGCKKTLYPLILKEIGPPKIKAGEVFNVQPDGVSAIWAKTENATETTVIILANKKIRTDFKNPQILIAIVPGELYSKPGLYQIYLLDTKTGAQSNSLTFIVE